MKAGCRVSVLPSAPSPSHPYLFSHLIPFSYNRSIYNGYSAVKKNMWYAFRMNIKIEPSWKEALKDEFEKPYFKELTEFVRGEYLAKKVFPPPQYIFNAFELTPFEKVKVVILGQDPYHGDGQ